MNIHKRTRLTLLDRQEIWWLFQTRLWKVAHLAECSYVSSPTIYDVLKRPRLQEFTPRDSTTYSDNGKEFKGTNALTFVKACRQYGIGQKFTRINRPQTNGKANESSVPDRYVAQRNLL